MKVINGWTNLKHDLIRKIDKNDTPELREELKKISRLCDIEVKKWLK